MRTPSLDEDDAVLKEAAALTDAGDTPKAIERLRRFIEQQPESRARFRLARLHFDCEQYAEALSILRQLVSANPMQFAPVFLLGLCLAKTQDTEGALRYVEMAQTLKPDALASALAERLRAQIELRDFRKALPEWLSGIEAAGSRGTKSRLYETLSSYAIVRYC